MKRKIVSWILAASMMVTSLPANSLQAWGSEPAGTDLVLEGADGSGIPEDVYAQIPSDDADANESAGQILQEVSEISGEQILSENPESAEGLEPEGDPEEGMPETVLTVEPDSDTYDGEADDLIEADFDIVEDTPDGIPEGAEEVSEEEAEAEPEEAAPAEDLITLEAAEGNAASDKEKVEEALDEGHQLVPGSSYAVRYTSQKCMHYYSITPESDGVYTIESYGDGGDTYVTLYSVQDPEAESPVLSWIAKDDDSGYNNHFKLKSFLNAGITYIYELRPYSYQGFSDVLDTTVSFSRVSSVTDAVLAAEDTIPITKDLIGSESPADSFLSATVSWEDGAEEVSEWTVSEYNMGGRNLDVLCYDPGEGRDALGVVFMDESGGYVGCQFPSDEFLPAGSTYKLIPFPLSQLEKAETWEEKAVTVTYDLMSSPPELVSGEAMEITTQDDGYGWAFFTAPADGDYYISAQLEDGSADSVRVYDPEDGGYSFRTEAVNPGFTLSEGAAVLIRLDADSDETQTWTVQAGEKQPLSDITFSSVSRSILDAGSISQLFSGITLGLVYGDGGDPLIQSVDLGSGWQDYDDEQSVYDLCAEGPYGEAVRLRFLKDGQRTSVPVCVDGEYPALGEYLIWAEVIPQGDDVTPGQSFSKGASLTLTMPESELLTADSRIDLEMDPNESRVFRIEVPSEEVPQEHAFMLWQEPGEDSISYLRYDAFRISEDGSFSILEGSEGITLQNWQWNASKLRLSSGQTLYLRIRHPETSGSDSYSGTLCLDPFLTVQNITLTPKETPLSAGSMLLDSRREWLTAEVTWSDGSSSPVSNWERGEMNLGAGAVPAMVLYQDYRESNKEPVAVAFRENGSFIDAPDVDEIPLGRTFDLVPFISDTPEDVERLSDQVLEGLTFTLGTEMKELVPGQSTQLWADRDCCYLAAYTADDDGEFFAEANGTGRSLKVYVFTSDDEGVNYRCCASGESPSFFLKEGETVILAASNDFSTRMSCNMTLSEKLPLSGVTLYDSEGTVFDAGYDEDGGCLADRIRMNFVYGEGDDGISQTVSLTGGGTDYDENNVAFCYGYGPYGEYVSIFFLDDEGNRIDAPQMNGSYLPEAGTYPVMAVLNWTDPKNGEERELTSNAVFTLGVPAFTQLSLTKAASYNIPVDGRAFFSCTAQKAGRYSFSLPTSSIFRYRFGWFERTDEGRIRLIDNGWVDTNGDSSGSVYADLEQGETVYLVLRSDEDGRSAKGSIQLTKIREIESAVLSVDQNRLYTFDTFTREPDFLEAVCTDEMGDSRTIREWGLDEVEIGDRQYTVMCGSDEGTEQVGVIFKEGDEYIDYPFEYRIPVDTDYTLQAFRMSDPEGIDAFAAQSPDIELSFRGSEQVTEVFADTPFAHDPAGPAEDWLLFTAPSDGEYYFSTSDNWTEFRLFQEEEDGYSYENGYQRTCTYTLHEGENRIICVLWDDPDDKGLEFTITEVKKITSVELSEVTAQIPALSPTYEQIGVSLRYEGEETPWQADRLYYDSGDLLTEGKFGEEIYISFYDTEGEQLDGLPFLGQEEWDDSEDDEVTRFEPGQWLISATADMYDPELERYVQVESEKKPFVQVPAEFTQMTPGDRKKFSVTPSSAGYFRFMAEEECCYRYWAEDCGSYLEAHRFTLDESGAYTYRDYDYLYDNLEDPSYFRTLDMSLGEPVYVLLGVDTEDEDQAARVAGWLCVDLETGLTEAAVQGAIPLKNGYTGAVSMKRGGEQYYSFLPDPEDPDRKPGEYIFVNDLEGQMDLELYARYGSSWILQESLCEEDVYDGKEVLSRYYDEGEEYIIALKGSSNCSGYLSFGIPETAQSCTINNLPETVSVLTAPLELADLSVTVSLPDGRTEEITDWERDGFNGYYNGSYLYAWNMEALSARSALTGQIMYLAAFADDGSMGVLSKNLDDYYRCFAGEYLVHLLVSDGERNGQEVYKDLASPIPFAILAPQQDLSVIGPDEGARSAEIAKGRARAYRLDVREGNTYRLQTKGTGAAVTSIFCVDAADDTSFTRKAKQASPSDYTWTVGSGEASGTYAVVCASDSDASQTLELTDQTGFMVKSVELTGSGTTPAFIEDMYWNEVWELLQGSGLTATVSYQDESQDQSLVVFADGSRRETDDHGNELWLEAFTESSDGTLRHKESGYYETLSPGTYYAAVGDYDSEMPYPAPGKTSSDNMKVSDVSAVGFRVISRDEAVAGHAFADGEAVLESAQGYYAGCTYTAGEDGAVRFRSPQTDLEDLVIFDTADDEMLDVTDQGDSSWRAFLKAGRTYQVFAKPAEACSFTLQAERMKSITKAVVSSYVTEATEGEWISTGAFRVSVEYEDGTTAQLRGPETDVWGNCFEYVFSDAEADPKEGYLFTISQNSSESVPAGVCRIQACECSSGLLSENEVILTVAESGTVMETLGLGEIKTLAAGKRGIYVFTPESDGLYSVLNNGMYEGYDFRNRISGDYSPTLLGGMVAELKAGAAYRIIIEPAGNEQYISVTRRTPLALTSEGADTVLTADGRQGGSLLIRAEETGVFRLQVDAAASGSTVSYWAGIDYEDPDAPGSDSSSGYTYLGETHAAAYSGYLSLAEGGLYLLNLEGISGGISSYRVRLTKENAQLQSWTIEPDATTDLPVQFANYYCYYTPKIEMTYSDGVTERIGHMDVGRFGHLMKSNWEWIDYNAGTVRLTVWVSGSGQPPQTQTVHFRKDYSVYPVLQENTPQAAGLYADGVYIYQFTPTSGSGYTLSIDSSDYYYTIYSVRSSMDDEGDNIPAYSLRKGETYLVCIAPETGPGAAQPTVAIYERNTHSVSGIVVTKGPDAVLREANNNAGITIRVSYLNGTEETYVFTGGSFSDGYGNTFYADRALLPSGDGSDMYRYTVHEEGGRTGTINVPLTDISTLPVVPTNKAAAEADAIDLDTARRYYRWCRFIPTQTAVYSFLGTCSKEGEYHSYAERIFRADTGEEVDRTSALEKNRTYLILQSAYASQGGRVGMYAEVQEAPEITGQEVRYVFEPKAGTGRQLPDAVMEVKPQDSFALQNTEADLSKPAVGERVETEDGYWFFEGYDKDTVRITNQSEAAFVTVTGTWSFGQDCSTVTYAFESSEGSPDLPEDLTAVLLPEPETWGIGKVLTPTLPEKTEYETVSGTWTFEGYEPSSVTVGTEDVTVTGTWTFTEEKHAVSYRFLPSSGSPALTGSVMDQLPEGMPSVTRGTSVSVRMPAEKELDDTTGRWIFTGYDVTGSVTVRSEDIVITGYWTYVTEVHTVNYFFVSSDGQAPDGNVLALLPAAHRDVAKGTVVTPKDLSGTEVESDHGTWIFDGYDKDSLTVGNEDATFTGTWIYVDDVHTVSYRFVSDGGTLPSEVTDLLPTEPKEAVRGEEVTAVQPAQTKVVSGDTTWSFLGYDQETVTVERKDIVFTGTWTSSEVHTVRFRFVSGTEGASFTGDAAVRKAIEALLPAEKTVKKGEAVTLEPAQGTAIPAASGAWMFSGYTTDYAEGEAPVYITELTVGSEDQELTGVWTYNEKTVEVSYRFIDADGKEITDQAVTQYLPEPVTLVKGKTHTPVSLAGTQADTQHGVWTFQSYDQASVTAGDEDIVITGTWTYAEVTAKVNYTYQSTGAQALPADIEEATGKPQSADLRMGDPLTLASPSKTTFDDIHGSWTFRGWHLEGSTQTVTEVTGGKTDTKVIGDWEYQEIRKKVSYRFEVSASSEPAGLALPGSITVPAAHEVRKGDPVTAVMPDPDEVEDTTGIWKFDEYRDYDPENPPVMGTEDIILTGTWTHTVEEHTVTYQFLYANDNSKEEYFTAAKAALEGKLPAPQTLTKGDPVTLKPEFVDGYEVTTEHGSWKFDGYEGNVPSVVGQDDITIKVKWTYADEVHQVLYADFECEDENGAACETPAEVAALKPTEEQTAVRGETVKPTAPSLTEITVGDVTWYFGGYKAGETMVSENGVLMESADITFTGMWSRKQKYTVSYEFASGLPAMALPDQVKALLADLPAQTGYKGDIVTLHTAADLTETTVVTAEGIWTFDGFDWSGDASVELSQNLLITGTWNYSPEGTADTNLTWKIEEGEDGKAVLTIGLQEGAASGAIGDYTDADPAPWSAAAGALGVTKIDIAEGITKIGGKAFAGINPVEQADLPRSLTQIADNAFEDGALTDSTKVNYAGTESEWAALTENNPSLAGANMTSTHEHTWTVQSVTTPATEESEGSMIVICNDCGETKTEVIPQIVLPQTISKAPAGFKAKAAKKGKVNLSWKKFKVTKKTKPIWKLVKKIEIQYSTDSTFKTGKVSKPIGKSKTKYVIKKLTKGATYYFRIRYLDGKGGVSKWSKVKKVKVK